MGRTIFCNQVYSDIIGGWRIVIEVLLFYCFIIRKMRQFNTFAANSPTNSSSRQTPHVLSPNFPFPSQTNSLNHEQRTGQFYKDTLKKIPSQKVLKEESEEEQQSIEYENHSQISLLLSQVSVPGAQRPEYDARRLFNLENSITQHILELREQKISLMQELSKLIDSKNIYEHYLLKKTKETDDRQTAYDSRIQHSPKTPGEEIVPVTISSQILRKNQQLNLRLKELQVKQEIFGPSYKENEADEPINKRTLEQIMQVRELNNKLKLEIASKMKSMEKESSSRFVTFQPQDKLKHQQITPLQQLHQLKEKYAKLVSQSKEPVFKLTPEEISYVESLRQENQALIREVEEMLRHKQASRLTQYRSKLQQNEREKSIFLSQLQKFKSSMKAVKEENTRLRRQLNL